MYGPRVAETASSAAYCSGALLYCTDTGLLSAVDCVTEPRCTDTPALSAAPVLDTSPCWTANGAANATCESPDEPYWTATGLAIPVCESPETPYWTATGRANAAVPTFSPRLTVTDADKTVCTSFGSLTLT